MNRNEKFRRIERRHKRASRFGVLLTILGIMNTGKSRNVGSAITIGGCICSIASFMTYVQSLEEYGLTKEVNETKLLANLLINIVLLPTIDSLLLANSLKDIIKK